jgi:hypothetical protein
MLRIGGFLVIAGAVAVAVFSGSTILMVAIVILSSSRTGAVVAAGVLSGST